MEVTLPQMLEARERRVWRQSALRKTGEGTLVCFTMNIAGPVKNDPEIEKGFDLGLRRLEGQLAVARMPVVGREIYREVTGCEAMLLVQGGPLALKALTVELEDGSPLGRLFDMDVFYPDGRKVERQELGRPERKCLLCENNAKACARSRSHTVAQLQQETRRILRRAIRRNLSTRVGELATRALLYEAATTPKPGLVDRQNSGSHRDMDIFTFQSSAAALWPYFSRCAQIGLDTREDAPEATFSALRPAGKTAEGTMLRATAGVNTHKGAIFSLGLLCAAVGRLKGQTDAQALLGECAAMTRGLTAGDYQGLTEATAKTAGQKLYLRYGITGVRGQAEAGFPTVKNVGLPKLEAALAAGKSINEAGCAALLAMLADTVDTNMIHRGGYERAMAVKGEIARLLDADPYPNETTLNRLDDAFIRENLSPGGTADLLAMVYLLHFLKEERL